MINNHHHRYEHDRTELLKEVFKPYPLDVVRYTVCRCGEIRTEVLHTLKSLPADNLASRAYKNNILHKE